MLITHQLIMHPKAASYSLLLVCPFSMIILNTEKWARILILNSYHICYSVKKTNSLSVQHISIFCWILKVYYFMHLTDFKKRSNDIRIWKKRLGVIFANSLPIFTYSMYNIWKFKYDRIIWDMVNYIKKISLNNRIFSGYDLWEITNRLKSTYIPETI